MNVCHYEGLNAVKCYDQDTTHAMVRAGQNCKEYREGFSISIPMTIPQTPSTTIPGPRQSLSKYTMLVAG